MITSALFPTQFLLGKIGSKSISFQDDPTTALQIDAMVEETHSSSVALTDYPIEDGSSISDHITMKPDQVSIQGVVSNSPIYLFNADFFVLNRVFTAYEVLYIFQKSRYLLSIVTGLRVYNNMIIESLKISRNAQNGQALEFTADAKRATIVQSQIGTISGSIPITAYQADAGTSSPLKVGGPTDKIKQVMTGGGNPLGFLGGYKFP